MESWELKAKALAEYLEIDPDEIEESNYDPYLHHGDGQDWLVITDEEIEDYFQKHVEENLWAFKPEFLVDYMEIFDGDEDIGTDMLKTLQEAKYEDATPIIRKLVDDRIDDLVGDAAAYDGRGHFLSTYDGEEIEVKIGDDYLYLYRTN